VKAGSSARNPLPRNFYDQPTLEVARNLIGARLCNQVGEQTISGIITETEAYIGEEDLGCHAKSGLTKRTAVMYGQSGMSYIYFTYGNHWMFCAVTETKGIPAAVLVRAVVIDQGLEIVRRNRGHVTRKLWTDGPRQVNPGNGNHWTVNIMRISPVQRVVFGLKREDRFQMKALLYAREWVYIMYLNLGNQFHGGFW